MPRQEVVLPRSYASPEWRATANPGAARRDEGDNVHAHTLLGPERRVIACRAPTKEANERTEVTEKNTDPSKEAIERKPGCQQEARGQRPRASDNPMMVMVDKNNGNKCMISVDRKALG